MMPRWLVEKFARGPKIRTVEALGEPGLDLVEYLARIILAALSLPQSSETRCSW